MPSHDCLWSGTQAEHEGLTTQGVFAPATIGADLIAKWERVLDLARAWDIPVVQEPNWRTRGRPYSTDYRGCLAHHTATSRFAAGDYPSRVIVRDGRSDLPGPLAQLGMGRTGSLWMIAAGYSNHAGGGDWNGLSGNGSVIGVEAENNGVDEPWTAGQIENYPKILAIVCFVFGFGSEMVCRHAEWSDGGKIDSWVPPFRDGNDLRARVERHLASLRQPTERTYVPGTSILTNIHACKVLDVAGQAVENDGRFNLWTLHGGGNQLVRFQPAGDGYVYIEFDHSRRVVDMDPSSLTVHQYDNLGLAWQQWSLTPVQNGYVIVNRHRPDLALDVFGQATTDGATVGAWKRNDGPAQVWAITNL